MDSEKLLEENARHWMTTCLREAQELPELSCPHVSFCETEQGELNLKREDNGTTEYYHSQNDPLQEAREWFQSLDLFNIETLFIYGIGLGYYYDAAKAWLKGKEDRYIVFLEDDLEVIRRLFETERGREINFDTKVMVLYFDKNPKKGQEQQGIHVLPLFYFMGDVSVSSLKYYAEKYGEFLPRLRNEIEYLKNFKTFHMLEYMNYGETFFNNFYRNILSLPSAYQGDGMFGKFKGIPAIVCGAGPSLEKAIPLLEQMGEHALIFAGGSAMNTVSASGFLPHCGVSIDPNWNQYARLFMNQAYQVPFFYRNRIFPEALSIIHGDHLYVPGAGGHMVAEYFEQKLGIEEDKIPEGSNVVNFSISIAKELGCDPIILLGVDLAYTDEKSYSKGISPHPVLDANRGVETRGKNEELIQKPDINGNPVNTLWKWIVESMWISKFAVHSPGTRVINATEGGIGMEGVPNVPFQEAAKQHLRKEFDLKSFLHGEIQNARMPSTVSKEAIVDAMKELKESFGRCRVLCFSLRQQFHKVAKEIYETKQNPKNLITDDALTALKELNKEPAYEYVLSVFHQNFLDFYGKARGELEQAPTEGATDQTELSMRRTNLNKRKYEFLAAVCDASDEYLHDALEMERISNLIATAFGEQIEQAKKIADELRQPDERYSEKYEVVNDSFLIEDEELNLSVKEKLETEPSKQSQAIDEYVFGEEKLHGRYTLAYPSGKPKMEQFYKEGKLHGPSSFFGDDGKLLARSWFVNGSREGKSEFYYANGDLYSIQKYRNGKWQGPQKFFYQGNKIRSLLSYQNGKLHGPTILYYPDGFKKREVHFQEGKRNGIEIVWNIGGIKEFEGQYKNDNPVGVFRSWYALGNRSREVTYDDEGGFVGIKAWNIDGTSVPEELFLRRDYFEAVKRETTSLTDSLDRISREVNTIASDLSSLKKGEDAATGSSFPDLSSELAELHQEMEKLKGFNLEMEKSTDGVSDDTAEALWKTPETRRLLGKQLQDATQKMAEDIKSLEEALHMTVNLLLKKGKPEDKDKNRDG